MMRGLYRRRGSPNWWVRYADPNGRIVRESTGTSEKTLAKKVLAKKRVLVVEGRHLDKKNVPKTTFFELCSQYWKLSGRYKRMKGLGNVPVCALTQQRVEKFLNERMTEKKLSPATRNRHLAHLSSMFNRGKEWGLITSNPAQGIRPLRENGARTRFLDGDEIERLLTASSDSFRPILITAFHTGMRRGEILKLKWADVDFKNRIITIQESKSGKKRMLPMDDTVCEALSLLPTRFQQGYVPSPVKEGQPRFGVQRPFGNAVTKANIDNFRFHDLRHTFASHLVMSGVDLMTVKELLGHATLTMTMRYTHLAPDHRMRAIKTLDSAYRTDTKSDTVENSGIDQLPQVVEN